MISFNAARFFLRNACFKSFKSLAQTHVDYSRILTLMFFKSPCELWSVVFALIFIFYESFLIVLSAYLFIDLKS